MQMETEKHNTETFQVLRNIEDPKESGTYPGILQTQQLNSKTEKPSHAKTKKNEETARARGAAAVSLVAARRAAYTATRGDALTQSDE